MDDARRQLLDDLRPLAAELADRDRRNFLRPYARMIALEISIKRPDFRMRALKLGEEGDDLDVLSRLVEEALRNGARP